MHAVKMPRGHESIVLHVQDVTEFCDRTERLGIGSVFLTPYVIKQDVYAGKLIDVKCAGTSSVLLMLLATSSGITSLSNIYDAKLYAPVQYYLILVVYVYAY